MAGCSAALSKGSIRWRAHLIFLTVGTQFGFDRLVMAVDECLSTGGVREEIFAQIGPGKYVPAYMKCVRTLEHGEYERILQSCNQIISHAGIGSIATAMRLQKPMLVMPRQKRYNEVVNDHQVKTSQKFEKMGYILAAYDTSDLEEKLNCLQDFVPKQRVPNRNGVYACISDYMSGK